MPDKHRKHVHALAFPPAGLGIRLLAIAVTLAALAVGFLVFGWSGPAWAQDAADCETTDLGALGADADAELAADGRWTTQDCDSRFRPASDAHTYRFEVGEAGRIRIDLTSEEADSFLYLFAEDGSRLADNDDGGAGLDARIERDLTPGAYTLEATTVGGRGRGAADFRLTIGHATGCDPVHLGSLEPGADLTATGSWTLDTCGSQFVVEHPAHSYTFDLPRGGHVRLDLTSENGDPVMSLVSTTDGLIAANDDGGERRNSRIRRYLQPGTYMVEATTYLERDYQPLMADFTLVIHLVDEQARQDGFLLKIEGRAHAGARGRGPAVRRPLPRGQPRRRRPGRRWRQRGGVRGGAARVRLHRPHRGVGWALGVRRLLPHGRADRERFERGDRRSCAVRGNAQEYRPVVGVRGGHHRRRGRRGARVPRPVAERDGAERHDVRRGDRERRRR